MRIRCVVTCREISGRPTFFPCEVECTQEEHDEGDHYDNAKAQALEEWHEDCGIVYDENDGPIWLFQELFPDMVFTFQYRCRDEECGHRWDEEWHSVDEDEDAECPVCGTGGNKHFHCVPKAKD